MKKALKNHHTTVRQSSQLLTSISHNWSKTN